MSVDEKMDWKEQIKQMKDTVGEVIHSRITEQKIETQSSVTLSTSQQHSHITQSQSLQPETRTMAKVKHAVPREKRLRKE